MSSGFLVSPLQTYPYISESQYIITHISSLLECKKAKAQKQNLYTCSFSTSCTPKRVVALLGSRSSKRALMLRLSKDATTNCPIMRMKYSETQTQSLARTKHEPFPCTYISIMLPSRSHKVKMLYRNYINQRSQIVNGKSQEEAPSLSKCRMSPNLLSPFSNIFYVNCPNKKTNMKRRQD